MKTKAEIRKECLQSRKSIPVAQREVWDLEIMDKVFSIIKNQFSNKAIHLYLPIAEKNEPDTTKLLARILSELPHCRAGVPKTTWQDRGMETYRVFSTTQYQLDANGIPEPDSDEIILPEQLELVVVPLLAYNAELHRIGYGQGFYDRYLKRCNRNVYKLGMSYFGPIEFEASALDIPLDSIITPESSITMNK